MTEILKIGIDLSYYCNPALSDFNEIYELSVACIIEDLHRRAFIFIRMKQDSYKLDKSWLNGFFSFSFSNVLSYKTYTGDVVEIRTYVPLSIRDSRVRN